MIQYLKENERKVIINGLILSVLLLICWSVGTKLFFPGLSKNMLTMLSRLTFWLYFGLIYLYVARVEKRSLLLWSDKSYPVGYYILSVIVLLLVIMFGGGIIGVVLELLGMLKISKTIIWMQNLSTPIKIFGAITAGLLEELIFRGYMMPRLELLLKNKYLPIIISTLIFGLAHIGYGTFVNVLIPMFIGLVFACHYYKYRNIKILIICHTLIDLNALLTPGLIKH
ncbi:CPBP family intramembrane glutamic endopeptidase [Mucilaginibacter sp. FT3.2]|uniref:CPBP family intramembrane glutamic endopeptidase n=1 Tax=Mucilaginibacter sp. FT3.2 TaxID=2723090 RepID=UPI0016079B6F|nr:type II CAAX endopeptidase family protein [Mucilaginibacter sp. FT3.2]MBB6232557.1 hypothetical protein [Mucilaginibacter sp. FT3.2]